MSTSTGVIVGVVVPVVVTVVVGATIIVRCLYVRMKRRMILKFKAHKLHSRMSLESHKLHSDGMIHLRSPNGLDFEEYIADDIELQQVAVPDGLIQAGPRRFRYEELRLATGDFSESQILGRGGFGYVFRGTIKVEGENGSVKEEMVAVKSVADNSSQGLREFVAEVNTISRLRHRNLVMLRGWCHVGQHIGARRLILVYDFMPNGSLDNLLYGDEAACEKLTWARRVSILYGLAAGLHYLHEECDIIIVHRDVKSSNVLLDEGFNAKLGDFGLSRQMEQGHLAHTTTLAGTRGYMAPELCFGTSKASKETDVYSFGAVLLEVACGKRTLDPCIENSQYVEGLLVDWVWNLHSQGQLLEAADRRLNGKYDKDQMQLILLLGLACCHPDPSARPTMRHLSEVLHIVVSSSDVQKSYFPSVPRFKPTPSYYHGVQNFPSHTLWTSMSDHTGLEDSTTTSSSNNMKDSPRTA